MSTVCNLHSPQCGLGRPPFINSGDSNDSSLGGRGRNEQTTQNSPPHFRLSHDQKRVITTAYSFQRCTVLRPGCCGVFFIISCAIVRFIANEKGQIVVLCKSLALERVYRRRKNNNNKKNTRSIDRILWDIPQDTTST